MKHFIILALFSMLSLPFIVGCEDDFKKIVLAEDDEGDELDELRDIERAIREEGQAIRVEIDQEGNDLQAEINNEGADLERAIRGAPPQTDPPFNTNDPAPSPPSGGGMGGSICGGNSLWKPISEGDGNLVVLADSGSNPSFISVNGEPGRFVGRTNGNRPTFRFSMPGCGYGNNVVITSDDGSCTVPNGCNRTEPMR